MKNYLYLTALAYIFTWQLKPVWAASRCEKKLLAIEAAQKMLTERFTLLEQSSTERSPVDFGLPEESEGVLKKYQTLDASETFFAYTYLLPDTNKAQTRIIEAKNPQLARSIVQTMSESKKTLTFVGYSGKGYEDESSMQSLGRVFIEKEQRTVDKLCVLIGATDDGVGQLYSAAQEMGAYTAGIVSSLGKPYLAAESTKHVDLVVIIKDESWGGFPDGKTKGTMEDLSPTSKAMVQTGDVYVAIGGGDVSGAELSVAKQENHASVTFIDMDMNHEKVILKWRKSESPGEPPTDFSSPVENYLNPPEEEVKIPEESWEVIDSSYYEDHDLIGLQARFTTEFLGKSVQKIGQINSVPKVTRDPRGEENAPTPFVLVLEDGSREEFRLRQIMSLEIVRP